MSKFSLTLDCAIIPIILFSTQSTIIIISYFNPLQFSNFVATLRNILHTVRKFMTTTDASIHFISDDINTKVDADAEGRQLLIERLLDRESKRRKPHTHFRHCKRCTERNRPRDDPGTAIPWSQRLKEWRHWQRKTVPLRVLDESACE